MSFLSFLLGEKKKTASVAKERLQIILAHERSGRNAAEPDYLPDLQRELIAVISKYIKINPDDIKVNLERQGNLEDVYKRQDQACTVLRGRGSGLPSRLPNTATVKICGFQRGVTGHVCCNKICCAAGQARHVRAQKCPVATGVPACLLYTSRCV